MAINIQLVRLMSIHNKTHHNKVNYSRHVTADKLRLLESQSITGRMCPCFEQMRG